MPAKYDRDGFAFQYPDNWVLEEDPSDGLPRTVSVTAESGAFWSLSIYDDGTPRQSFSNKRSRHFRKSTRGSRLMNLRSS